jgi:hypothetical protein
MGPVLAHSGPEGKRRLVRSWRKLTLHPWRICWSTDRNLLSVERQRRAPGGLGSARGCASPATHGAVLGRRMVSCRRTVSARRALPHVVNRWRGSGGVADIAPHAANGMGRDGDRHGLNGHKVLWGRMSWAGGKRCVFSRQASRSVRISSHGHSLVLFLLTAFASGQVRCACCLVG